MVSSAKLRCAAESDPGRVRSNNEDRVYCDPERGIFLVVDGIGGQAAGEKAADVAITMIRNRLERQTGNTDDRIREAITVANNEILRLARGNPDWEGMACVLTVALVEKDSVWIGHVGDSRLYKIRAGLIQKITHDHSPVGEREDSRELSEEDAMRHPRRNEVYRDVGSEEHTPQDPGFIELLQIPFEPDCALLLCSDGLSDQVTSAEIRRMVEGNGADPRAVVQKLIAAANRAGGKDNVSVVIVEGPTFHAKTMPARNPLAARPALVFYGFLAGLILFAALQLRFGWLDSHPYVPPIPPPKTLVVSQAADAQFGSIGDALAKARPGDTVEVAGGEYLEQIHLREGVTLVSRVPQAAIVRAAGEGTGPAVVAENVKDGRVTGLRILADPKMPLSIGILLAGSGVEISDCEISGAGTAIEIRGGHPVLRGNSIQDSLQSGLVITGDATPRISHNVIARNGRKTKKPGVRIEEPARPVLIGNTFVDNGGPPVVLPAGMDHAPIQQFNFFPRATTPPRIRTGETP